MLVHLIQLVLQASLLLFANGEWTSFQQEDVHEIRGRVLDDIRHGPVPLASLTLTGGGLAAPLIVKTNGEGEFRFANLYSGRYSLKVEKAQMFSSADLQVLLEGHDPVQMPDITLVQMRAISGLIRWRSGDPVEGASVLPLLVQAGEAVDSPANSVLSVTNLRGEFHLFGLQPGHYVLAASYSKLTGDGLPPQVAVPQFYPQLSWPHAASSLDVAVVSGVSDVLITLDEKTGVTVSGSIARASGSTSNPRIGLAIIVPGIPMPPVAFANVHPGEQFVFSGIPDGEYLLQTFTDRLARHFEPLSVRGKDIRGLRVATPEEQMTPFRVVLDEPNRNPGEPTPQSVPPLSNIRLFADCPDFGRFGKAVAVTDGSGIASMVAVAPGSTYNLSIENIPSNTYVDAISQGRSHVRFGPFSFMASQDVVTVYLRRDSSVVTGIVSDGKLKPTRAFVVLIPDDVAAKNRIRTQMTSIDGVFTFQQLAPGLYHVFAFDRDDAGWYLDETYRKRYSGQAVPITLLPSVTITIQLDRVVLPVM